MSDLTASVFFTKNTGVPAEGLTLADIDLYLAEVDKVTGVDSVIWDGTQNPTEEVDNIGAYIRIYTGADFDANHYFLRGSYTGATILDVDHVTGATECCDVPIGTAVEFTYTLLSTVVPNPPIAGARVTISTDLAGTNMIWGGDTDAFGVARDDAGQLPRLDPGTYYFWRSLAGWIFTNPDTETVS
jgi:hypothetical protein